MADETETTTTAVATTATESATGDTLDLKRFLSSMRLNPDISEPVPMVTNNLKTVAENVGEEDRFISGLAAVLMNIDGTLGKFDKGEVLKLIAHIDDLVNAQLNQIIHNESFKRWKQIGAH